MKRLLSWILGLPVAVLLIAFAVANRRDTSVSLDPFSLQDPWIVLSIPLWQVLFAGIFLGLIAGWCLAWLNQGRWRKSAREAQSELAEARASLNRLQKNKDTGDADPLSSAITSDPLAIRGPD